MLGAQSSRTNPGLVLALPAAAASSSARDPYRTHPDIPPFTLAKQVNGRYGLCKGTGYYDRQITEFVDVFVRVRGNAIPSTLKLTNEGPMGSNHVPCWLRHENDWSTVPLSVVTI